VHSSTTAETKDAPAAERCDHSGARSAQGRYCRATCKPEKFLPHHRKDVVYDLDWDITERKRAEEALRQSEARFRTFVDHATDIFMLHDENGNVLDVNLNACESLGYGRDELIGKPPFFFDLELNAGTWQRHRRHIKAGALRRLRVAIAERTTPCSR
jgi:PAS domain-containing protein